MRKPQPFQMSSRWFFSLARRQSRSRLRLSEAKKAFAACPEMPEFTQRCLNPCYSSRWSRRMITLYVHDEKTVLILVIAVDGLGEVSLWEPCKALVFSTCLVRKR